MVESRKVRTTRIVSVLYVDCGHSAGTRKVELNQDVGRWMDWEHCFAASGRQASLRPSFGRAPQPGWLPRGQSHFMFEFKAPRVRRAGDTLLVSQSHELSAEALWTDHGMIRHSRRKRGTLARHCDAATTTGCGCQLGARR